MFIIKFYGIKCRAIITDDSFELIAGNKVAQWLLNAYGWIILHMIELVALVCNLLNIEHTTDFKLEVLQELGDGE